MANDPKKKLNWKKIYHCIFDPILYFFIPENIYKISLNPVCSTVHALLV